ncbi:MAG: hypothetical protein Q9160_003283 [Pyrenula sp. 1 TL-2023]
MPIQRNAATKALEPSRQISSTQQPNALLGHSITRPPMTPPPNAAQDNFKLPPGRDWPSSLPFDRLLTQEEHLNWALQETKNQFELLRLWVSAVHPRATRQDIRQEVEKRWLWFHHRALRSLCHPNDELCRQISRIYPPKDAGDAILTQCRLLYVLEARKTAARRTRKYNIDLVIRRHASQCMLLTWALRKRLNEYDIDSAVGRESPGSEENRPWRSYLTYLAAHHREEYPCIFPDSTQEVEGPHRLSDLDDMFSSSSQPQAPPAPAPPLSLSTALERESPNSPPAEAGSISREERSWR